MPLLYIEDSERQGAAAKEKKGCGVVDARLSFSSTMSDSENQKTFVRSRSRDRHQELNWEEQDDGR